MAAEVFFKLDQFAKCLISHVSVTYSVNGPLSPYKRVLFSIDPLIDVRMLYGQVRLLIAKPLVPKNRFKNELRNKSTQS